MREITAETLDLGLLRKGQGHKYDHGHALVLTGGAGRSGAGRLAGMAALRIGAGAVTLGVPPAAQMEVAVQITALMLRRVADGDGLRAVLEDARFSALCLGPGMGLSEGKGDLVAAALHSGRACVLDADALTLISQEGALMGALHGGCVLTPHGGEFARLFPDVSMADKARAAARAADRAGCALLLKGAETVIAAPGGAVSVHRAEGARAVPWLATAGAGDVLAGLITGLMARGIAPMQAAELGAFVHVECARAFGPGLIAEDFSGAVPGVLAALGAGAPD
ncbi:NAD(P)H-hydrate dehydratase [Harenicola maris]|uniref:NAD(P)H-hydrate dehydratase n=1 Tax=Harenicola maris TaxID=2841044 RepID=UPI002E1764BF